MLGLTDDNRDEVLGLLLIALGLLLGLSLAPPRWIGILFTEGIGSENLAGPLGEFIKERLLFIFGFGAYLIPFLVVLWGGSRFFERSPAFPARITILLFGGTYLYLSALSIRGVDVAENGWLAEVTSRWFLSNIGLFGSLLVIYSLGIIMIVMTTGFRIRRVALFVVRGFAFLGQNVYGQFRYLYETVADWNHERKRLRRKEMERRVKEKLGVKTVKVREKPKPTTPKRTEKVPTPKAVEPYRVAGESEMDTGDGIYQFPPLSLLQSVKEETTGRSEKEKEELAEVLIEKLGDFNIRGEVVDIVSGPVITMFELKPAPGVKVSQIQNLSDDLAMAMRAQRIRVVAPIPGKGAVGIEVPNYQPETVLLSEIIGSDDFRREERIIPLPLGKSIVGEPVTADLASMPHLLIAGATGSGKSVNIHCIITGFLYRFPPDDLSMIMIDPKMLELGIYKGIPHLLVPVVTDPKEAVKTLKWAVHEMEERYSHLASLGVRSIQEYNRRVVNGTGNLEKKLPFLVIIIDELADLILTMQNEVEEPLARLAQMARGVGIHLILATQRPSVDVITGMIKANFPSRISFQVASKIDSRTILDTNGAEKLLGKGDMLFMPGGSSNPIRIHGAFISHGELESVVHYVRKQLNVLGPEDTAGIVSEIREIEEEDKPYGEDRDELFDEAARLVIRYGHGSTSLLQRRLKIGYTRAARIVDQLEAASIVGPPDGSKAREVIADESYLEDEGIDSNSA